jgi:hypothetical protein
MQTNFNPTTFLSLNEFRMCEKIWTLPVKVSKRSLNGRPLFIGKAPGMRTFRNLAQNIEEVLYSAMAVFQHAKGTRPDGCAIRSYLQTLDS